jgi:hypothetical protein
MEIREVKANKLDDEFEDFFTRRWNPGGTWAFIKRIHDEIRRDMRLRGEHFFEAFYHGTIARFPFSAVVCVVKAGE